MISILWYACFSFEILIFFIPVFIAVIDGTRNVTPTVLKKSTGLEGMVFHGSLLFLFPILLWKLCICGLQL